MQRIQSLFLIITIIAAIMFANVDYIKVSNGNTIIASANIKGVFAIDGNSVSTEFSTLPVTALSILIGLSAVVSLFLFRNRKIQMRIILLVIATEIVMVGFLYYGITKLTTTIDGNYVPSLSLFLLVIMIVASILAYRGVRSDEKLIESLNRLR